MSKKRSDKKYEEIKSFYKEKASAKEKELHMDLLAVRHEYVPHHLKRKFLTGLGIFGSVYLVEKLIFGKKIPRIIRFTTSLSAIVLAPKVYRLLEDKFLAIGELKPVEMEMLEDQQLSNDAATLPDTSSDVDLYPSKPPVDNSYATETEPPLHYEEEGSSSKMPAATPADPEETLPIPPNSDLLQGDEENDDNKEK